MLKIKIINDYAWIDESSDNLSFDMGVLQLVHNGYGVGGEMDGIPKMLPNGDRMPEISFSALDILLGLPKKINGKYKITSATAEELDAMMESQYATEEKIDEFVGGSILPIEQTDEEAEPDTDLDSGLQLNPEE